MIMLVAAGHAHAQSAEQPAAHADTATPAEATVPAVPDQVLADDLIAVTGLRPIGKRRVELLITTGSEATHGAALRASERRGTLGFELTAQRLTSDVLTAQSDANARIEHAGERDRVRVHGGYVGTRTETGRQSFASDVTTTSYGGEWLAWRPSGRYELQAFGEHQDLRDDLTTVTLELESSTLGARAGLGTRRLQAFGLDHELGIGVGLVRTASVASEDDRDPEMLTHMTMLSRTKHGQHRFLSAYIHDTIRMIESLDMRGGFVFEHWRWLTSVPPLAPDEDPMETDSEEQLSELNLGPSLGAVIRVSPELALEANAYRRLRVPTAHQLMRPVLNGPVLTTAGELRAETVTGAELGPALTAGPLDARAVVYWNEVDAPIAAVTVSDTLRERTNLGHARETGLEVAATVRVATPWRAGVTYTFANAVVTAADAHPELVGTRMPQTPRHRARMVLAYDRPKIATLTGAVRYVDRRYEDDRNTITAHAYTVVDAMASRALTHGLAGFVAVENLFDRRYITHHAGVDALAAPRMLHVGLRIDSERW